MWVVTERAVFRLRAGVGLELTEVRCCRAGSHQLCCQHSPANAVIAETAQQLSSSAFEILPAGCQQQLCWSHSTRVACACYSDDLAEKACMQALVA